MSDLVARIEQAQYQLKEIAAFHRRYLDRRKAQHVHTGTDVIMEHHQGQLAESLDVLEMCKAHSSRNWSGRVKHGWKASMRKSWLCMHGE
jgi:hypothetical protein